MADIELVIKIDEEIYQHTQEYEVGGFNIENDTKLFIAIKNGKLLPKGHGDLKDADAYTSKINRVFPCNDRDDTIIRKATKFAMESTPIIIPADKE